DRALTASPLTAFRSTGEAGMRLPTDVAVAPSGDVYVADGLNDRVLQFDSKGDLIAEHARGRRDNSHLLWILWMLELWHRRYIDH
ncbi:MAG TPA: hypothetical protein PKO33_01910, partial [Pyrinomonadaceae bacterium]|nr:hypothetical protein [Pyrinomonadaceae bacterium]